MKVIPSPSQLNQFPNRDAAVDGSERVPQQDALQSWVQSDLTSTPLLNKMSPRADATEYGRCAQRGP